MQFGARGRMPFLVHVSTRGSQMSNVSTGLDPARLERFARAIENAKAHDGRESFLKSVLNGALQIASASRGHAALMDGDTVVAESSRTSSGESYKVDSESRKLAARAAVRLTASAANKRFAIEIHGARASLAARVEGRVAVSVVLDRPDLSADPGCGFTVAWLLATAAILRAIEREPTNGAVAAPAAAHTNGGVGAVRFLKTVDELERDAIELALRETHWKKDEAARKLGISRASIYMKVKKYNLQAPPIA